jgi:hypothetical protein
VISSNPSRDEGPMATGRRLARSAAPLYALGNA